MKIFNYTLLVFALLFLVGMALPYLFSHKSNELPLLGLGIIFIVIVAALNIIIPLIRKQTGRNKK